MGKKNLMTVLILAVIGVVVVLAVWKMAVKQNDIAPVAVNHKQSTTSIKNANNATTVDVNAVLAKFPSSTSTQAEKDAFNKNVRQLSVDSSTLDITNCVPTPTIMHVRIGKPFILINKDSIERAITHTQFTLVAPPNSRKEINQTFPGEGAFGYRCGGKTVGIIFVSQ